MASYAASALSVFSRYLTCMVISISKLPVHMCRFKQIKGYIALVPGSFCEEGKAARASLFPIINILLHSCLAARHPGVDDGEQ